MKPWIVIPVHNRRALTLACVQHLDTIGAFESAHVLVVDDGSTDGTAAALRAQFPQVEILSGNGDLWWTGAIAAGMARAFAGDASAVCWLNDDCHLNLNTLDRLGRCAEAHPLTIVAPTCLDRTTGRPIAAGAFIGRKPITTPEQAETYVDGVSGFCVWITREIWQRAGLPNATYFPHYYGDTAYMLAARQAGCAVLLLKEVTVTLVEYRQRPATPGAYASRLRAAGSPTSATWTETFSSKRSPFRLATQFRYLSLRYGRVAGASLAVVRFISWQFSWLSAAAFRDRADAHPRI